MKPFLTPQATIMRDQRTTPEAQSPQPAAARSTVLLSLLLAPRHADDDEPGSRDR
jgi:hypothetical protein